MVENRIGQFEELKDNQIQVFTQATLKRANDRAVKLGLNRSAYRTALKELFAKQSVGTFYPVIFSVIHNNREIRAKVQLNKEGETVFIDVPLKFWSKDVLTLTKDEEGEWETK